MKTRFLLLLLAAGLSGCATFDRTEIARVREHGVSPGVVAKLDLGKPVAPTDVIELSKRGVPDEWIIRQIDDHGVNSYITRSDVTSMRHAGVRPAVVDAMTSASRRFAERYYYDRDPYFYGSFYGDPFYDYYGPYPYYGYGDGWGTTVLLPGFFHGRGHFHHHH
jgi:hypothetical protein